MFERTIEILANHIRAYQENVAEWEKVEDPYGMNRVRALELQKNIGELEEAISRLKRKMEPQMHTDEGDVPRSGIRVHPCLSVVKTNGGETA